MLILALGEAEPPGGPAPPGPAPGRAAAQPMPGTEPWPQPSPPVHETTVPGDGQVRGDHVPDE
jgi:hypothetical protein